MIAGIRRLVRGALFDSSGTLSLSRVILLFVALEVTAITWLVVAWCWYVTANNLMEEAAPLAGNLEWNAAVSSSVEIWINDSERDFLVTKVGVRKADVDFTGFTDTFSLGTNSPDYDNILEFAVDPLADPLDAFFATSKSPSFRIVPAGGSIYVNPSGTTTGHFTMDIWGYYVDPAE